MQNMQAACKDPARVAQPAEKAETKRYDTMRHDITRAYTPSTAQRAIQSFADFRHPSLDLGHSRFEET